MKRPGLVALGIGLVAVAAALLYTTLSREAQYNRLMVEGETALATDQPFVAIEDFSGAIVLKPRSMPAYLRRGEAYRRRGDLQTALRDFRKAVDLDARAPKPLEDLGDVNFALERFARAAESYDKCLALDDRSATVLYKAALTRFRLGQPDTAARQLGQAVRLNDRFAEAFYLLAITQAQNGQTDAAIDAVQRAVALAPTVRGGGPATAADQQRFEVAAREEFIRLLLLAKRDADAARELQQLAALEPGRPDHLIDAGLIFARLGRTDEAWAELNRAAERDPSSARAWEALGRFWLERRDVSLNKALEALDRAVRLPDARSAAFTLRGRAQLMSGDVAGAQQSLEQALRRQPVDQAAYREMASLAEHRGDLALARDSLVRYLALTTDDRDTRQLPEQIGEMCLRMDDRPEATRWLKQASESGPDDAVTLARVAGLQLRAGDATGAAATIDRGLAKMPANPALLALRRRVQAIPPPAATTPPR